MSGAALVVALWMCSCYCNSSSGENSKEESTDYMFPPGSVVVCLPFLAATLPGRPGAALRSAVVRADAMGSFLSRL